METPSEKMDLFKLHKGEYKAGASPGLVDVAPAQYLAIDGRGTPNGAAFEECIGAMYSMAFTIKMRRKAAGFADYVVGKLECTWFLPDGTGDFSQVPPEEWQWTLMIRTPEDVLREDLDRAVEVLRSKGKAARVDEVRLETIREGKCVQMMHVGPYDKVHETVVETARYCAEQGFAFSGRHHEIYLSDPRRVEPEKLKTIVRQPVAPVS